MAYSKTTWVTGDTVTATKLNHAEDGISTAQSTADGAAASVAALGAAGAIGTANLADASVTNAKLDQDAVDSDNIRNGAVITPTIYDGAVTTAKLGADVQDILDNKADIDGSYDGMSVGNAEQLISSVGITDETPYNFRTSGGSTEIGDREELNAVVGSSVAWNQYCDYNETTPSNNWTALRSSLTISGRTMTIASTADASNQKGCTLKGFETISGHKYFVSGVCTPPSETYGANIGFYDSGTAKDRVNYAAGSGATDISRIMSADGNGYVFRILLANASPSGTSMTAKDVTLIDLTLALGATIANYIYTLEQSNAGAGVAWFRKLFPKPYYAYNSGALLSARTNLHRMTGFNAYNPTTGTAKVVGGNQYQITGAYTALSLDGTTITPDANGKFTPSANGTLTVTGGNSTTTCVHLVWDGEKDGEFEPFEAHEYALDDITLRGILKLDASNNLYADGDRYLPGGTVERLFAERAYQSGDESLTDAITDGTTTVYKLATPTTESASPYQQTQIVDDFGTEEFVDAAVESGERDVAVPVGNETVYKPNLRAKLEMAPNSPSDGDGLYVVQQISGENTYVPLVIPNEIPPAPTTDGAYVLKATVADGTATYSWVSDS